MEAADPSVCGRPMSACFNSAVLTAPSFSLAPAGGRGHTAPAPTSVGRVLAGGFWKQKDPEVNHEL
jgi:hypothetical protein